MVLSAEKNLFLEIGVRWILSSSKNWWSFLCQWKKKSESEKAKLLAKVKGNYCCTAKNEHFGYKSLRIISVTNLVASDNLYQESGSARNSTTFASYYKEVFKVDLNPDGPILLCRYAGSRRLLRYPAEFLDALFNMDKKANNLKQTRMYAAERICRLNEICCKIEGSSAKSILKKFGISIEVDTKEYFIANRNEILQAPQISLLGGMSVPTGEYLYSYGYPHLFVPECMKLPSAPFIKILCSDLKECSNAIEGLKKIGFESMIREGSVGKVTGDESVYICKVDSPDSPLCTETTKVCGELGVLFQCYIAPQHPQTLALQLLSKFGYFPFSFHTKDFVSSPKWLLTIGLDLSSANEKNECLLTLVAILIQPSDSNDEWKHFSNHYWIDTKTEGGRRFVEPEIMEHIFDFVNMVTNYFNLCLRKSEGNIILICSPACSAKLAFLFERPLFFKALFEWKVCVIGMQEKSTRVAWDIKGSKDTLDCRNVPRGLCFDDTIYIPSSIGGSNTQKLLGFRLCGANCEAGHSNVYFYYFVENTSDFTLPQLKQLLYSFCFTNPNFPGALPLPMPVKAAKVYNRKYFPLKLKKLAPNLRHSMHYL